MNRLFYYVFLAASIVASSIGMGSNDVMAKESNVTSEPLKANAASGETLNFSDVLNNAADNGKLIAAHYSHSSHSSHSSHRSHYSSRY